MCLLVGRRMGVCDGWVGRRMGVCGLVAGWVFVMGGLVGA